MSSINFPGLSTTVALLSNASRTGTVNGPTLDVRPFAGAALVTLTKGTAPAGTLAVRLQHSNPGGVDWTDVPDGAFPAATAGAVVSALAVPVDGLRAELRAVGVVTGVDAHIYAVTLSCPVK